jgi:hypothetical protein
MKKCLKCDSKDEQEEEGGGRVRKSNNLLEFDGCHKIDRQVSNGNYFCMNLKKMKNSK